MKPIEYEKNISYKGSAELDVHNLPSDYVSLIEKLANIHLNITVSVRDNRVKLEMPSPKALELDGKKEIFSKHLGVDLTSYLVQHRNVCAICFKYNVKYDIHALMHMTPLDQRGYSDVHRRVVKGGNRQDSLVLDSNGNLVPPEPGESIPITELPEDHFAVQYLRRRGFEDLHTLYEQFETSYCYRENPHTYFAKNAHEFKKTPQTRIIFYMNINGVTQGYQGRLIDYVNEHGVKYILHPYYFNWFPFSYSVDGKETYFPHITQDFISKLPKYYIGIGCARNQTLLGFDAAKKYSNGTVVLVEGVLDAAKIGPPAISVQGKDFSQQQANLLVQALDNHGSRLVKKIIVIGDNDESGTKLVKEVKEKFMKYNIKVKELNVPSKYTDVGDMTIHEARQLVQNEL